MKLTEDVIIKGRRAMVRSYAKINLSLDVVGVRQDGYHDIETVMQTINLSDIVLVDRADFGIKVTTNKKYLPTNNKNIAYKASELFFNELGKKPRVKIFIHKNIPVSAGMAGGSGNGAAVLAALNCLYNTPFSEEELLKMGAKIGADVPYCLIGGTQKAEGIGEILTPVSPMQKHYVLIVTPPISISTPWVYSEYDKIERTIYPNTNALISALENNDYYGICNNLSNVLEEVTIKKHPVIGGIKEKLLRNGANGVLMSGSGPTVFGFFDDYKKAKASCDSFSLLYQDVYLTTTIQ